MPKINPDAVNSPSISSGAFPLVKSDLKLTDESVFNKQHDEFVNGQSVPQVGLNEQQLKDLQSSYVDPREHKALDNQKDISPLLNQMKQLMSDANAPSGGSVSLQDQKINKLVSNQPSSVAIIPQQSYMDKLTELQDRANRMGSLMDLGRAMTAASGTMVGSKENPLDKVLAGMKEDVLSTPKQFIGLKEQEKNDPNSDISKQYRAIAARMGFGAETKNSSAADIEKLTPQLANIYNQLEARKARHEDLVLKLQELGLKKQELQQEKQARETTKRFDELNKKLVSEIASSRTTFGTDAKTLQGVQNVKALIEGKDPNELDNREVYEVAKVLDRILSQGNPTISGSAKLTPDTARGLVSKYLEYFTNKRTGAGAGSFIERFSKTLDREEKQAINRIMQTQLLSSYSDLEQKDPGKWDLIMQQHNLPSDILTKKNVTKEEKDTVKQDPKVVQYSKQYNLNYDDALKLLKKRGYNAE
jgi:hypothetical protein